MAERITICTRRIQLADECLRSQGVLYWTATTGEEFSSTAPRQALPGDCGVDLHVAADTTLPPGEPIDIPLGIKVELPPGVWGLLIGRSSTLRQHRLTVHPGVIDTGYRGPLFALTENLCNFPQEVSRGTRIAQLVLLPNLVDGLQIQYTDALSSSARGEKGFGSTGI